MTIPPTVIRYEPIDRGFAVVITTDESRFQVYEFVQHDSPKTLLIDSKLYKTESDAIRAFDVWRNGGTLP